MAESSIDTAATVSVVIAAYNAAATLSAAIDSVLAQTRPVDQIIVVDDGSTDTTADIARSYGDAVTLIQQPNAGPAAARNAGIAAAVGTWIAFLDADDQWHPHKQARQMAALAMNPQAVWSMADFDEQFGTHRVRRSVFAGWHDRVGDNQLWIDFFDLIVLPAKPCMDTAIVRRDVLTAVGGFYEPWRRAEDNDLWWRIAYRHRQIVFLNESLAVYHRAAPGTLSAGLSDASHCLAFIDRHRDLAAQHGCSERIAPLLSRLLFSWIRGALFDPAHVADIRTVYCSHGSLLSPLRRAVLWPARCFPQFTCHLLRTVGAVKRRLRH